MLNVKIRKIITFKNHEKGNTTNLFAYKRIFTLVYYTKSNKT